MYRVFVRNWWRRNAAGGLEPNPGARKTIINYCDTESEARAYCKAYNDTHAPGPLSRKAEYTQGAQ